MIALIEADNTYDTIYGIGYFGLGKLTGVSYDESHDGAWWREWWEKNKHRYPVEIQALEIPRLTAAKQTAKSGSSAAEVASRELFAGGDTNKLFYLIGQTNLTSAHPAGFRLLLVLPGGDGGRNFHPFVKRISQNALPDGYLVAQLVPPQWDEKQSEQLVWPTETNPYSGMNFSTEQFVESVIEEVSRMHKIDSRHIYTLSWSSGGPAGYAVLLNPGTKIAGSLVAMSVFKTSQLPDLSAAEGKLHSPFAPGFYSPADGGIGTRGPRCTRRLDLSSNL